MPARRGLLALQLEERSPKPEPACDHEWDDVEPNPLAFRVVRVCVRCGVAAGHPEDDEQ